MIQPNVALGHESLSSWDIELSCGLQQTIDLVHLLSTACRLQQASYHVPITSYILPLEKPAEDEEWNPVEKELLSLLFAMTCGEHWPQAIDDMSDCSVLIDLGWRRKTQLHSLLALLLLAADSLTEAHAVCGFRWYSVLPAEGLAGVRLAAIAHKTQNEC